MNTDSFKVKKQKKYLQLAGRFGYWLVILLIVGIVVLTVMSTLGVPKELQILVVRSGSMEPVIKTGALIFVRSQSAYSEGDIITFIPEGEKESVTHRIAAIQEQEGIKSFITKGDANNSEDAWQVVRESVLGKVLFNVPYLGYLVAYAKTQMGFILLVVIPATLIVYSEVVDIKKEIKRKMRERRKKDQDMSNETQEAEV